MNTTADLLSKCVFRCGAAQSNPNVGIDISDVTSVIQDSKENMQRFLSTELAKVTRIGPDPHPSAKHIQWRV